MKRLALGANNKNKTIIMGCQENETLYSKNKWRQYQDSSKQRQFHSNKYFSYQNRAGKVNTDSAEEVRIKKIKIVKRIK